MDYSTFKNDFISGCRERLAAHTRTDAYEGGDIFIEEKPVKKAQFGELTGLIFRKGDSTCAPTIYVEDFYRLHRDGYSAGTLSVSAVNSILPYIDSGPDISEDAFEDTANLRVRLLNRARNRDYLENVPHIDNNCGLALTAEIRSGEFSAVVTDDLLDSMEMGKDELFEIALANSSVNDPPVLFDLSELLTEGHDSCRNLLGGDSGSDLPGSDACSILPAPDTLYLLSNRSCFRGAAVLFYPGITEKIGRLLGGAFFVLPSSIHEVLILPVSEGDPQRLADIIGSANRTVVSDEDYLSDDLLLCEEGRLRRVIRGDAAPASGAKACWLT